MKVKIYTTPSCGYCQEAKRYLKENGVEYEEVNVAEDFSAARELVKRTRQHGVPVIDVGGTLVVGFDRRRLAALLAAA
ncbi:MAG: glutaredoxin family protein [Chloroflexota bacterium]